MIQKPLRPLREIDIFILRQYVCCKQGGRVRHPDLRACPFTNGKELYKFNPRKDVSFLSKTKREGLANCLLSIAHCIQETLRILRNLRETCWFEIMEGTL